MNRKTGALLGLIESPSRARARLERLEKSFGRIVKPRPWIREFLRRKGRLPYRAEVEQYFLLLREMIEYRKHLREVAGVQK